MTTIDDLPHPPLAAGAAATDAPPGPPAPAFTPVPAPPPRARHPRRPSDLTAADIWAYGGCAASSASLCWLIFARLTQGVGWFGFILCVIAVFLVLLYLVTRDRLGHLAAVDRVAGTVVILGSGVLLIPLAWLVGYVVVKGLPTLRPDFFVEDQAGVTPVMPSTAGGGSHAVVGTVQQVGLALMFSLPLALSAAVFLNETRSPWRRPVRIFVDAMSGLPSVVAGLFIFAVLILPFAQDFTLFSYNGFMASLALAIIMLPTITRTVEVVLRLVPDGLREASLALGSSRARMVWSIVMPTARTGMTTAVVLGIARAVGETAPLLFTAFGYDLMNANPFNGAQESLPLFVYRNIRKPDVSAVERGFAGALVLMLIVLTLFAIARYVGRDRSKSVAKRRTRAARTTETSP